MKKVKVFVITDVEGTEITYTDIDDALTALKAEAGGLPDEDIEEEPLELTLTVKFMTEDELAAMPEYQP